MIKENFIKEMNFGRPEAVGNIGTVWPPGITGLKINYQSPHLGTQLFGPIHGYSYAPYPMITPMYLGFPYSYAFGYPIIQYRTGFVRY
ncbi:hypothetical protein [Paenibacillus sp. Soil724D2]|uniref:hypothetical protein n=1 Tax=Paenibacillus sp. (strain Soil724D2) TaxID=1736392 RepID=UPI00070CB838|nr:hypothetical protein [Paenibacillus sp. Soil724D2]KQX44563.1 hypothetical protein ASD40_21400 [Paenibacillus sp. Root444D2]KRE32868.1 hypothetical protein ASG85_15255 [Paenibacillus sp. Soil724D2]